MWKLTRNKYVRYGFHLLEQIGIKKSKNFVYMINLENKSVPKEKLPVLHSISIRLCTKEDIDRLPDGHDKSRFLKDLKEGHVMVGAFFNGYIVGWLWLSFQKVYVAEIETWVDFDCGFIWKMFVMQKFRKKGIGKEIIERALKITEKTFEKKEVYAYVETDNIPSQRAFESVGFKKQGIISYFRFFNLKRWRGENS